MGGGNLPLSETGSSGYPQLNFTPKGQQIRNIYQDRLKQFTATGQYEAQNLRSMFISDREGGEDYVKLEVYSVPDLKRISFDEAMKGPLPCPQCYMDNG
jgi:alpha-mannosidase